VSYTLFYQAFQARPPAAPTAASRDSGDSADELVDLPAAAKLAGPLQL